MISHKKFTVIGKVQGVFFRASTQKVAIDNGIKGFVKNQQNGSVYIEAEGNDSQLSEFKNWLKEGPPFSKVSELIEIDGSVKNFDSFEIVYE